MPVPERWVLSRGAGAGGNLHSTRAAVCLLPAGQLLTCCGQVAHASCTLVWTSAKQLPLLCRCFPGWCTWCDCHHPPGLCKAQPGGAGHNTNCQEAVEKRPPVMHHCLCLYLYALYNIMMHHHYAAMLSTSLLEKSRATSNRVYLPWVCSQSSWRCCPNELVMQAKITMLQSSFVLQLKHMEGGHIAKNQTNEPSACLPYKNGRGEPNLLAPTIRPFAAQEPIGHIVT